MENKPTYEELQAQVEALRVAALNAISFMSGGEAKAQLRDAYDATPQQHLAEIRAECVERALKTISHRWKPDTYGDAAFMRVSELKEYADKIRQGGYK